MASLISTSFHFFQQLDQQNWKNRYKETGSRATYSEPLIVQTHTFYFYNVSIALQGRLDITGNR